MNYEIIRKLMTELFSDQLILSIIIFFLGGILSGYLLGKFKFGDIKLEKLNLQNKLEEDKKTYQIIINKQNAELTELRANLQDMRDKATNVENLKTSNIELNNLVETLKQELNSEKEEKTKFQTEITSAKDQHEKYINFVNEIQHSLKEEFENIGNKIFNENSKNFREESHHKLNEILTPLKIDIDNFRQKVEESFGEQAKEQHSLKNEIERIAKINKHMTSEASNLTKALKGDFKIQGNWGEFILERILEESGLRQGEDYLLQNQEMEIKTPDSDYSLKPDVIVKLPENKHIIIDSQVSLIDYEKYCSEENKSERKIFLKDFLSSLKKHVDSLEKKQYQDDDELKSPDFILMFIPVEGAFSLAMQEDKGLHSYAWNKKVVIVCPAILFATLRTIASIWRLELQHRNTREIAKQGGFLYDKIVGFIEDMQQLGTQLKNSQETYLTAMNKLSEGRGNILSKAQQLQKLGTKTQQNFYNIIPQTLDNNKDKSDLPPEG